MAITDPAAIKFANESARAAADRLSQAYYLCRAVSNRWNGLGGATSEKVAVMESDIRHAADHVLAVRDFIDDIRLLWFVIGSTSLIPDDVGEAIVDGSPSDGRPAISGQDVVRVVTQTQNYYGWMHGGSFESAPAVNSAYRNTVLAVASKGKPGMSDADAINFVSSRCSELVTEYEATSSLKLRYLLAVAVNPNPRNI